MTTWTNILLIIYRHTKQKKEKQINNERYLYHVDKEIFFREFRMNYFVVRLKEKKKKKKREDQ
jgi:hypothetical protein